MPRVEWPLRAPVSGARARLLDQRGQPLGVDLPLVKPSTIVRSLAIGELKGQVYLEPRPAELLLRDHVSFGQSPRASAV